MKFVTQVNLCLELITNEQNNKKNKNQEWESSGWEEETEIKEESWIFLNGDWGYEISYPGYVMLKTDER